MPDNNHQGPKCRGVTHPLEKTGIANPDTRDGAGPLRPGRDGLTCDPDCGLTQHVLSVASTARALQKMDEHQQTFYP